MIEIESTEQFKEEVAKDQLTVAFFAAGFCGGCKMIKPKIKKLDKELEHVNFLQVDAEDFEDFVEEIDVDSFPTFRVYKKNEILGDYCSSKYEKVDEFIRKTIA